MLLFDDIVRAEKIVSKHTFTTPVVHSQTLSKAIGDQIYLKLENQQITGSFKIRGAINAISNLNPAQKKGRSGSVVYRKPWPGPGFCCKFDEDKMYNMHVQACS